MGFYWDFNGILMGFYGDIQLFENYEFHVENRSWWTQWTQSFMKTGSLCILSIELPSGELTFCHGKSPFSMGKPTISMAIFNCFL